MSEQKQGFSAKKYLQLQAEAIRKRQADFKGKLYVEIGGHFLRDGHASRVLPGFDPKCKIGIIKDVSKHKRLDIVLCVNAKDIEHNRVYDDASQSYTETLWKFLSSLRDEELPKPKIAFNLVKDEKIIQPVRDALNEKGYHTYVRHFIEGYPQDLKKVMSEDGFGADDHIQTDGDLVIVIGLGSNSGKLTTCLGSIYLDRVRSGLSSGYAKYELFPIFNLPVDHPVNLAYEAATADIGDYVTVDSFHRDAYGKTFSNYNRDVDAFPVLRALIDGVVDKDSPMRKYKSPTDMGINNAGFAMEDESVCINAAIEEIKRRKDRYAEQVRQGKGQQEWVDICSKLLERVTH